MSRILKREKKKEALQSEVGRVVEHYGEGERGVGTRGVRAVIAVVVVQGRCRGAEADHITGKPRGVAMSGKHLKSCMRQLVTDLTGEGLPALHGKTRSCRFSPDEGEEEIHAASFRGFAPVVAKDGDKGRVRGEIKTENNEKMKTGNKKRRIKL